MKRLAFIGVIILVLIISLTAYYRYNQPRQNVAAQEAMALKTALQEIVAARQNITDESEPKKSTEPTDSDGAANASSTINRSQHETNDETAPSFLRELRDSTKRSVWHKTWIRTSLVLVSVALSLLLVLQMAVQERDRLATLFPQVKPALEAVCIQKT